jgi:formiminotetrahydrofolate cyclodeaminase
MIAKQGKELNKKITDWIESVIQPDQKTFQDVINFPNKLNAQLLYIYGNINSSIPPITEGAKQRLSDLQDQWNERKKARQAIIDNDVAAFNAIFEENNIPAVITEME